MFAEQRLTRSEAHALRGSRAQRLTRSEAQKLCARSFAQRLRGLRVRSDAQRLGAPGGGRGWAAYLG